MIDRTKDRLIVNAGGDIAGFLDRSDVSRTSTRFTYDDDLPETRAISLVMPIRHDPYIWKWGVHPIFEMNLPEGELRDALQRRFSKVVQGFDDFAMLSVVGPYQLGRVTLANPNLTNTSAPVSLQQLLTYRGTEDLCEYLLNTYAPYSGVSGVQPKVLVRDEETAAVERITQRTATHIVKTWREEQHPQLAANEFFCLRAAELAGLQVPDYSLSDNGRLLIVKRFDLPTDDRYLGFEDLCALSGFASKRKYDGSYEQCAKQLHTFASPDNKQEAMEQFFKSVALSYAVQNGDAHRKNFGVLYTDASEQAEVWIAPTYDIVTTTAYLSQDMPALTLAGKKLWPTAAVLAKFGRTACGLSEGVVSQLLEQVGDGISAAREELSAYAHNTPEFQAIAEKMTSAWNVGQLHSLRSNKEATISLRANTSMSGSDLSM